MIRSRVKQLERLQKWLWDNDYELIMSGSHLVEDSADIDDKIVYINTRSSLINQIYSLLHECGHVIQHKNTTKYYKKFPVVRKAEKVDGRHGHSNVFLMNVIDEELEAWKQGEKLARRLKFAFNTKKYNEYAATWVIGGYVRKIGTYGYRGLIKTRTEILKDEDNKRRSIDIPQPLCYNRDIQVRKRRYLKWQNPSPKKFRRQIQRMKTLI